MVKQQRKQIAAQSTISNEVVPVGSMPPQEPLLVEQDSENPKRVRLEALAQERFMRVAQTKNLKIAEHLMTPLTRIIGRFSTAETVAQSLMIACDMLENLAPQGTAQNMLAQQMICTHFAALANLTTARADDNTMEQADHYTNRATRLMRLSVAQMELWARLKGQTGQQKVTVEHVHVNAGGQAMVGMITKGGGSPHDK